MSFLRDYLRYFVQRRKYWMVPVILLMLIFGGLLVVFEGSALAPFIYTMF